MTEAEQAEKDMVHIGMRLVKVRLGIIQDMVEAARDFDSLNQHWDTMDGLWSALADGIKILGSALDDEK
jgi:hypothetical protein